MKIIKLLATGLFTLLISLSLLAQNPPDPPDEHGETQDQEPGGNAPLGAGTVILLGLGAIYGTKKVLDLRKKEE
jgi:hypothetical protein